MKKMLLLIFGLLAVGLVFFYYAQSPNLDEADHNSVRKYNGEVAGATDTLTVMTFNIGYLSGMTNNIPVDRPKVLLEKNLKAAIELIGNVNPHIVGFQEIDFGSARSFYVHQLDSIATSLKYAASYQSVNWDKSYVPFPYWPPSAHFGEMVSGQAILSRFQIAETNTTVLQKPINAPLHYKLMYLERLIQVAQVKIGGHEWTIMNVHLEAFDEETRVAQAHVVKAAFNELSEKGPVLLIGDFNSRPDFESTSNEAMKVLMQSNRIASAITKAMYEDNPSGHYTFNTAEPYQMIDYLFYNSNFVECLGARVVAEAGEISDHLPLVGSFRRIQ